jgi:malonate transporter
MTDASAQVFAATGPIYLLILAGFLCVRWRVFDAAQTRVLGRFVTLIAVPALLLRSLTSRSLSDILNPRFMLIYAVGSLLTLAAGWFYVRRVRRGDAAKAGMMAMGMASSNSAFVAYPIAAQLLGPSAGLALALVMLVENLIVLPLAMMLADSGNAEGSTWRRLVTIARNMARNPMIVAIVFSLAFAATGLQPPGMLQQTVHLVAGSASPLALFAIGGALVGLKPGGILVDVGAITFGKLVLHPLTVLIGLALLPLADPQMQRAAMIFSCVPMLSIYAVLAQKHQLEGLCAAALLAATTLSFLTINFWLAWT